MLGAGVVEGDASDGHGAGVQADDLAALHVPKLGGVVRGRGDEISRVRAKARVPYPPAQAST